MINKKYGCQVIVNGVASTLKYYLRMISSADRFIREYLQLVETDIEISFDLKREWNDAVSGEKDAL